MLQFENNPCGRFPFKGSGVKGGIGSNNFEIQIPIAIGAKNEMKTARENNYVEN